MLKLLTLLKNKWVWIGLVMIGLTGYTAVLKLSYASLELTHQDTLHSLQTVSHQLSQAQTTIASQELEQAKLIRARELDGELSSKVLNELNTLKQDNITLKQSIQILKKEEPQVEEYLNTVIPQSIVDRLRMEY